LVDTQYFVKEADEDEDNVYREDDSYLEEAQGFLDLAAEKEQLFFKLVIKMLYENSLDNVNRPDVIVLRPRDLPSRQESPKSIIRLNLGYSPDVLDDDRWSCKDKNETFEGDFFEVMVRAMQEIVDIARRHALDEIGRLLDAITFIEDRGQNKHITLDVPRPY
jgi:hypothetical protein